jgi:hypothetical protein
MPAFTRCKQGVEPVIRQMEYLVSERVYGGHVFMAGGVVGKTQTQSVLALIYLMVECLTIHYVVVVRLHRLPVLRPGDIDKLL